MSSDMVDGAKSNRAAKDWSAQSCGCGQRVRNDRAAQSDAGFPRPVAAWLARHADNMTSADGIGARSGVGALAGAGSIELGFHVGGGQMDVTGGGVDVRVAQQGLHHGQIDTSLGQRGAERVP